MKLTKGEKYEVADLECTGWNTDDVDGYNYIDYFSADGEYLGADEFGVEPEFAE